MCVDPHQEQKPCSSLSLTVPIGHHSPDSSRPTYCFFPVRPGWLPQSPGTSCGRSCAHCPFPPSLHQPALGTCEMLREEEMVISLKLLTCTAFITWCMAHLCGCGMGCCRHMLALPSPQQQRAPPQRGSCYHGDGCQDALLEEGQRWQPPRQLSESCPIESLHLNERGK